MEFTIARRVGRRARGMLAGGGAGVVGAVGWLVAAGGHKPGGPLTALGLAVAVLVVGIRERARLKKPFHLMVDDFGITLHDAELSWEQIAAVALHHPPQSGDEDDDPVPPRLVVWPAPGVTLPRRPDRTFDGRRRYTLVDTGDLDQGTAALGAALAQYGGARYETAPRSLRPPTPVTVSGPEHRVPGAERVFTAHSPALGPAALALLALSATLVLPLVDLLLTRRMPVPAQLLGVWFLGTAFTWWATARTIRHWRRPLRLRIGPAGIAVRDTSAPADFRIPWPDIAAVTVGPAPNATDTRPWLTVWPLPGTPLDRGRTHLVDGHQAYALIRLDRLPGGAPAVLPTLHTFAGERLTATPTDLPA
ncbi:hypothetical protein [Actinacidiphila acididurans]|uniref:PH domain-containing protein n=1 Tax=Actinacidiphila acididurans TaxID=2784346 RepID=A0ABS2U1H2_9ACTN|nr:hypothetical protein [Actinacidiphila acididurans]MBM9508586.1 hypothetical protein [Actinacidiphila acididurans]